MPVPCVRLFPTSSTRSETKAAGVGNYAISVSGDTGTSLAELSRSDKRRALAANRLIAQSSQNDPEPTFGSSQSGRLIPLTSVIERLVGADLKTQGKKGLHMSHPIQLTNATRSIKKSIGRSPRRRGFRLIPLALALAWLALSPSVRAVVPAPDGGYPNANTAEGEDALANLTTGLGNTGIGFRALFHNTTGSSNTGTGVNALQSNSAGSFNTAHGAAALAGNAGGDNNTATGVNALLLNRMGSDNTATGFEALRFNIDGQNNSATGHRALFHNSTAHNNTANGTSALFSNTTGGSNTAVGLHALRENTTGHDNTAIGAHALGDNITGHNNIALGYFAGGNLTTGDQNIVIGNAGVAGQAHTIRIGTQGTHSTTYVAGITGNTVARGMTVYVAANGRLGTFPSTERLKEEIKPIGQASEAILALKPVTFRYKQELDPEGIAQFGLVAEEVEQVNPDLVVRNETGKAYTVRYEAVNAMLLNEFLKEHRKVREQEAKIVRIKSNLTEQQATIALLKATVTQQQRELNSLTASFKKQASQIQKISDRMELRKPAPQLIADDSKAQRSPAAAKGCTGTATAAAPMT